MYEEREFKKAGFSLHKGKAEPLLDPQNDPVCPREPAGRPNVTQNPQLLLLAMISLVLG